jgi:hypothetical protein
MAPRNHEDAKDRDVFFPPPGRSNLIAVAKKVCDGCPVVDECREWRDRMHCRHGVFGGEKGDLK